MQFLLKREWGCMGSEHRVICNADDSPHVSQGLNIAPFAPPMMTSHNHRWWVCGCCNERGREQHHRSQGNQHIAKCGGVPAGHYAPAGSNACVATEHPTAPCPVLCVACGLASIMPTLRCAGDGLLHSVLFLWLHLHCALLSVPGQIPPVLSSPLSLSTTS